MAFLKSTFNAISYTKIFKGSTIISRFFGRVNVEELGSPPPTFSGIVLPEYRKLPVMPKVPPYYSSQKPPRLRKAHNDIRGPERVQNTLLHNQYGIIALSGGYMNFSHFELIRLSINREMDSRKTFAVWRVDAPWKPVTKLSIGKSKGGGKGRVHHYSTPIKAGRIIIEVGGKVEYEEVFPYMNRVAKKMPFDALVISNEMFQEIEEEAKTLQAKNINPFNFEYAVKMNLHNCNKWVGPYDKWYHGKYI